MRELIDLYVYRYDGVFGKTGYICAIPLDGVTYVIFLYLFPMIPFGVVGYFLFRRRTLVPCNSDVI
jgi:hypothetical protein